MTAFVSQTPWIEGGTVEENVLFGLPMVRYRYHAVLQACGLDKDIDILVDGDQTSVGPKGVSLSGGQRWRIALARAVYGRAGTLVLDDVLSAVDAHVAERVAHQALSGRLAEGRTRILATHHVDLVLPMASYAVHLSNGRVVSAEHLDPPDDLALLLSARGADEQPGHAVYGASGSGSSTDVSVLDDDQQKNKSQAAMREKEKEEKRVRGRVKWNVYLTYFGASGGWVWWIAGIAILAMGHLMRVLRTWSLKELSDIDESSTNGSTGHASPAGRGPDRTVMFWLGAYVIVYFGVCVWQAIRVMYVFFLGQNASRALFRLMTRSILRAPLRWVDTVPAGRILNRFTSDMYMVDRRLSTQVFTFFRHFLMLVVIIGTSLSVSWFIVIFAAALFILYARVASQYIMAAREAKRINSVSHSPIYDQLGTVINGLSTVRAYGRSDAYMDRMHELIDASQKANWAMELSTRWMGFRMGMLGALFVAVVAMYITLGGTNAALAGFVMTFANRYTNTLTSLLRVMTTVELGFNACERVIEYSKIETEPGDGVDPPAAWPARGRIEVDGVTAAYAENLPTVLKGVSFTIQPGERIGVVGRTGAGKSTLASLLFRLLTPREGTVRIDGVDIATLKLSQLRSRLAVIPQDPFLFSGTLRSNLDMEGIHDDRTLLHALRRVRLIEAADVPDLVGTARYDDENTNVGSNDAATSTTLSGPISPDPNSFSNLAMPICVGGTNLSQGQRQLVCLARVLLQRPKILVLDEATSAVDRGTDAATQASLREEFAALGCTVLVIAHRLSTVADFDRLLVLDRGRVVEMGAPKDLLQEGLARSGKGADADSEATDMGEKAEGTFWGLVQKSAERQKLFDMVLHGKGYGET